jgi:ATP-binding cassette subfamily B protein
VTVDEESVNTESVNPESVDTETGLGGVASWRGIATEKLDEVSAPLEALLRKRSRRLLADLLRPHRRAVAWTAAAIVVASLAALAGPWLIGIATAASRPW